MHQHILKVSELTKKVRFLLESELNSVWLCGEISNFINASSGHWYLSLKDSKSQVKCAMFKGANRRVRLAKSPPKNGMQVLVRAKVSLYEPRGDFQLIIEHLEDAGEGLLRQQFEQLKSRLNNEGLFDRQHKKTIPNNIAHVGIITSPTGAAVKDILTVLKRRNPFVQATIYPALVQGQQAKDDIASAIYQANHHGQCDVLIVGRGGGSLEDLWPFNEEVVVRAIHQSELPVISAVGHEIDTTLSDFVADLRAPTPSAAAEMVSTDIATQLDKIQLFRNRLSKTTLNTLQHQENRLVSTLHRLKRVHPHQQLQYHHQKADDLQQSLEKVIAQILLTLKTKPQQLNHRLQSLSPSKKLEDKSKQLIHAQRALQASMMRIKQQKIDQFTHLIEQLHIVSPLATIARGYSISRTSKNKLLTNTCQVDTGDKISIQVSDGEVRATVGEVITKQVT